VRRPSSTAGQHGFDEAAPSQGAAGKARERLQAKDLGAHLPVQQPGAGAPCEGELQVGRGGREIGNVGDRLVVDTGAQVQNDPLAERLGDAFVREPQPVHSAIERNAIALVALRDRFGRERGVHRAETNGRADEAAQVEPAVHAGRGDGPARGRLEDQGVEPCLAARRGAALVAQCPRRCPHVERAIGLQVAAEDEFGEL
jgi:hypothetical protein